MKLSIHNLEVHYESSGEPVQAVNDVSFGIEEAEIVGLLGESGGGKSSLAKSIVRDLPENGSIVSGSIAYGDSEITSLSPAEIQNLRWDEIAYVPQNAMNSLDPVYTIEEQLTETITAHRDVSSQEKVEKAREVLDLVGIDQSRIQDYPHQMSGGMKQRIILAMSLILDPQLIIADEPTTGLDVLLRDKILADIERYREELDVSFLIVSHDIADLVETCDRLLVMYGGKIVEKGDSRSLITSPRHPYTIGLKNSLPALDQSSADLVTMNMEPPDLKEPPKGCIFVDKCPFETNECRESHPEFDEDGKSQSACYRADEHHRLNQTVQVDGWGEVE